MTVEHRANQLVIHDQPFRFWLFYLFFILGGTVALILSLTAAPDRLTTVIGSVIGVSNIAGGLYMIWRDPASTVVFDLESAEVRVLRWHLIGQRDTAYPLVSVTRADVEATEHTDGGLVYRPRLHIEQVGSVPVSVFWYQTLDDSRRIVEAIRLVLQLPGHPHD